MSTQNTALYWSAFAFALAGFLCAIKYAVDPVFGWRPANKWSETNLYGTYPIWMGGFLCAALAMAFLDAATKKNKD